MCGSFSPPSMPSARSKIDAYEDENGEGYLGEAKKLSLLSRKKSGAHKFFVGSRLSGQEGKHNGYRSPQCAPILVR